MTRYSVLIAIVAASLAPADAGAGPILDWLSGRRTVYAPVVPDYTAGYAAAPCGTCTTTCTQKVCSYVPQTAYRTSYVNVPVTTYRPVTTQNACSGCTTTCMRPITTYVQRPTVVPYTAYRQVCRTVTSQPTTTYLAQPAYAPAPVAEPACSSCNVTPAAYTYAQPQGASATLGGATGYSDPGAMTNPAISPNTYIPPATPSVSSGRLSTSPGYSSTYPNGSTYSNSYAAPAAPQSSTAPQTPTDAETQGSGLLRLDNGPDLSDPLDKTAYRQSGGWRVYNTANERVARAPQAAAPEKSPVQRGGWRVVD